MKKAWAKDTTEPLSALHETNHGENIYREIRHVYKDTYGGQPVVIKKVPELVVLGVKGYAGTFTQCVSPR